MADVAGDLWLLLIAVTTRERIVRENEGRRRAQDGEEVVRRVAAGLQPLWGDLEGIIAECEAAMRRAGKRDASGGLMLDGEAGEAFVYCMFGRDDQLEATQELMNQIRVWKFQSDLICTTAVKGRAMGESQHRSWVV